MRRESAREPRLSYLVKWVERGLRQRLDDALSPHGLTTPEYTVLSVLSQRDGLSSAQLARRVWVTPQAMNQLVIALERRGLITRVAGQSNGRTMCTTLTVAGKQLLAACDRATLPAEESVLGRLKPAESRALRKALLICIETMTEMESVGGAEPDGAGSRRRAGDQIAR